LLITWDEHGGFYDHAPPPPATPPGDEATNLSRAGPQSPHFAFDTFGVRVPAVLVSPWIGKGGLGSQVFPGAVFDHTSVISSLREHFALGGPITRRDAAAPSWSSGLAGTLRTGAVDGPATLGPVAIGTAPAQTPATAEGVFPSDSTAEPDPFIEGMALIALDQDRFVSQQQGTLPLATPAFHDQIVTKTLRTEALASGADFNLQLLAYIKQIEAKVVAHKAAVRAGT